jgi:hypothetical protein
MALVVNFEGQFVGSLKPRQNSKGYGNPKFQKRSCVAVGHAYIVDDQGNAWLKGGTFFGLLEGEGLGEGIEPKETSQQKRGTFQQKVPAIHRGLLFQRSRFFGLGFTLPMKAFEAME